MYFNDTINKHSRTRLESINVNGDSGGVQEPPPSTPAEHCHLMCLPVSFMCLSCGARPSTCLNWKAVRSAHYVHGEERWTLTGHKGAVHTVSLTLGGSGGLLTATLGPAKPAWVRTPTRLTRVSVHFLILCSLDSFIPGRLHIQISSSIAVSDNQFFIFHRVDVLDASFDP